MKSVSQMGKKNPCVRRETGYESEEGPDGEEKVRRLGPSV